MPPSLFCFTFLSLPWPWRPSLAPILAPPPAAAHSVRESIGRITKQISGKRKEKAVTSLDAITRVRGDSLSPKGIACPGAREATQGDALSAESGGGSRDWGTGTLSGLESCVTALCVCVRACVYISVYLCV